MATTYEDRLASFQPRKVKSTKKSALNSYLAKGWPHPAGYKATPSSLAHAGFYFDPTADKGDNVTCFTCEHSLGEWTENDDPFVEHLNVDPKCPWALARCSIELDRQRDGSFVFTMAARLPTSKSLEKARADTFKGNWMHDQTKGHTANSKKMAKAGWIYNGGTAEDSDIATCYYCGKSLDGWEMGDDPTKEHKNRVPDCPVFTATLTAEPPSPPTPVVLPPPVAAQPPVSTASTAKTQATTKRGKKNQATSAEVSDAAGTESDAPSQAKRGRSKKSAAVRMKEDREDSVQPPPSQTSAAESSNPKGKTKKSTRSVSVSRKERAETPEPMEEPIQKPAPTAKGKGKKVDKAETASVHEDARAASVIVQEEEEDEPIKVPAKKKATKKKPAKKAKSTRAASVTSQDPDDAMEMDEPDHVEEDVTPVVAKNVRGADSIGGWESMEAANQELEEMAKELHIEGEFNAIGKKAGPSAKAKPERAATGSKAATKKTTESKKPAAKKEEKKVAPEDRWTWREKSVETRSVVTELEAEMTEEEEVEKSLAGDSDDEEDDLSPPPSRAPSVAPSKGASTAASTTVSSKTKAKVKEIKMAKGPEGVAQKMLKVQEMWRDDEEMVDASTPKAKPAAPVPAPAQPSAPAMEHAPSSSGPSLMPKGGFTTSMNTQLEAPTISADVSSYMLTEEEREMTLEEWIRFDVERRKEEIRIEGRKWIEGFLENADAMRDKIRAL